MGGRDLIKTALKTLAAPFLKTNPAGEGNWHPGPYHIFGVNGGCLPGEWGFWNHWQMDLDPIRMGPSAIVEACVSAYAQTIATCPLNHWRDLGNGGRELVTTSALSRLMRAPSDYQTRSDFLLNLVRSLFLDGNAYALCLRNDRFEIQEAHLMNPRFSGAQQFEGEIFYHLAGNEVIEARLAAFGANGLAAVPARNVLHVKLHTPRTPLRGETPLTSAALAVAASNAMGKQMLTFFANMSRPSGVLSTDAPLQKQQIQELREAWEERAKGLNAGGVPILAHGIKWYPLSMSAEDAQFVEIMKLSDQQIASVFRVPLPIVGSEAQPLGSTEALMNFWIGYGLGFPLNQIELAFDQLFRLPPAEYTEFDTSILLRSAFRERIEGLARGVQGGIFAPNEARAREGLPAVKEGDEPRVQQQVVPLSWTGFKPAPPKPSPPPAAAAPQASAQADEPTPPAKELARMIETAANRLGHEERIH